MVCLIKEKYKTELQQYKDILGSEEAAYYVLAMNNGYTLDYTPEGKQSELYNALLTKNNGDVKQSIIDKSLIFTPGFIAVRGNFTEGEYSGNKDQNGEPSIQDLNGGALCDSSAIIDFLQEQGNLNEKNQSIINILDTLEKNNFLIREFTLKDALDFNRNVYSDLKIKEYIENNPNADLLDVFKAKADANAKWDEEKIDALMGQYQKRLAEYFDLEKVEDGDGTFHYQTKEKSRQHKLRVHFVNSLRKEDWKDEDGNWHKGLFKSSDGRDAAINLILISLEDGDPTTFIHELAHHYIQVFWQSDVVQKALQFIDNKQFGLVRRFNKDPRPLEEKLVNAIVDKVLQQDSQSWVSKFWHDFAKMVKNVLKLDLLNYNQKQNIIDQITMYMSLNTDLSYNKADNVIYKYLRGNRYSGSNQELVDEIYRNTLRSLNRKRNAIKSKILKDNSALSQIEYSIQELEEIDPTTQAFTDYMVNLVKQAKRDLIILSTQLVQWGFNKEEFFNVNPKQLVDVQTDILEYYSSLFGSKNTDITSYIERNISKEVSDQIESIRSLLDSVAASFNLRIKEYTYNIIEQQADRLITVGDKQLFIANAKLWLNSQVDGGSLMFGENVIGIASQSKSPIIRLVAFLTNSSNNYVRRNVLPVGHKMYDLYKKCNFDISFKNAMKMFFELDENGDPTGYLIRPLNYGRMYKDKDNLINKLLNSEKYKDKVTMNDEGEFVFLDENIRNEFLDEKDDLEDTICNKKYTSDFYKDRRRFLPQEIIKIQDKLQRQIDIIIQKCTDSATGVPEIHKLTSSERNQLNSLYKQKENLASPYEILYAPDGSIRSFKLKEGTDFEIAEKLIAWKTHLQDKIKYLPNNNKFNKHREYLVNKYGENSSAVKWFDWYYSTKQITPEFYEKKNEIMQHHFGVNDLPNNIKHLYKLKSIIINAIKDKHGYYQPHLEKLNDDAWKELKRIDQEISDYFSQNPSEKISDDEEIEQISKKELVKRYVNDKLTNEKYLMYLRDITPEDKFYDKYYYERDGELIPLSVFFYERPYDPKYIQDLPTGPYSTLDPESFYANPDYNVNDTSYIQPKESLYKNEDFYKITGNKRVFYDYVLQIMQEANSYIPNYIDTRSFRAPGMTEKSSHLLFRKHGNFLKNCWHYFTQKYATVSDVDIDYNEEVAVKPNGERVYTIPLRWVRKLENPADTCTDLIGSVMSYYEMAMNYKVMSEFAPLVELIKTSMQGGTTASGGSVKDNAQIQRLEKYMEMYIYGKMRRGMEDENKKMSSTQKIIQTVLDKLARNSYLKMMAHNFRGIIKNAIDSGMSAIVEMSAGKYFDRSDVVFAMGICGRDVLSGAKSINTPNNLSKVSAAMQYNGQSGNISDIFSGLRDSSARRFFSRFYQMGEYSFVDYTIKGWLAPAIYHNHRLIQNFDCREVEINGDKHYITKKEAERIGLLQEWERSSKYRYEYMNKQQAIYNYIQFGKTAAEGQKAWEDQTETLWDAYEVNEVGDFVLSPEFLDKVRPIYYSTGKRSTALEDRIAGTMRERFAVIAGMLPYENKGQFLQTSIGMFVFLLRGWLITFYWDCLRAGNDFSTWRKKSFFDKKATSDQAQIAAEDISFYQQMFEFETGQTGKGWLRGQGYLWKKIFLNGCYKLLNFFFRANRVSKRINTTEKQQVAKLTQYIFMAILCIIGTNIFGRLLEDDPDNLLYNFGQSESLALTPERTTQLNPLTVLDLIKNATAAQSYLDEIDHVITIPYDYGKTAIWAYNWAMNDPEFESNQDEVIKTGSYKGITKWQRDALKSSSIVAPGLGFNNIFKNISPNGHRAYQTWQSGQTPNQQLLNSGIMYKPNKKKNSGSGGGKKSKYVNL